MPRHDATTDIAEWPMCRPCGTHGNIRYATHILNSTSVSNWYLCDAHTAVILKHMRGDYDDIQLLPHATEVRKLELGVYY